MRADAIVISREAAAATASHTELLWNLLDKNLNEDELKEVVCIDYPASSHCLLESPLECEGSTGFPFRLGEDGGTFRSIILCNEEHYEEVQSIDSMHMHSIPIRKQTINDLLHGCTKKKDLAAGMGEETIDDLLHGCIKNKDLAGGRDLHSLIVSNGPDFSSVLGDRLIRLFASCGSLLEANLAFCNIAKPNILAWQAIISAHATHGQSDRALELYHEMHQDGIQANKFIFPCILKACGSSGAIGQGKLIHGLISHSKLDSDVIVGSSLVDMYAKCGHLNEARKVFDELPNRNVVSWAAMITGYAQHGHGQSALVLFEEMQWVGVKPDKVTFLCILKACGSIGDIRQGKLIHNQIIRSELESDVVLANTIVDMYAKCGDLEQARKVFDKLPEPSVVSWTAMITRYVQNGQSVLALELLEKMQIEGTKPNNIIWPCILKACGNIGALGPGKLIHNTIITSRFEMDVVIGSAVVDMYAKCGNLEEARKVFEELPERNVVSWGAMIGAYTKHGHGSIALELFKRLQQEGIKPDIITFIYIFKACGNIGALGQGKLIHNQIIGSGLDSDVVVVSTLIDMYAKCGSLKEAREAFDKLPNQNVVAWGAMIAGYAHHGSWSLARQCIEIMQKQGLQPNGTIYTSILSACSHTGHVEEGHQFFKSMMEDHGIAPSIEHLTCLVDLLGSAGRLKEAEQILLTMPIPPDEIGWTSLLTACRTYGNVELGRQCFDQVTRLDSTAAGYVLMSNIYAYAHLWENAYKMRELQTYACAWKKPGRAWIELSTKIQEFTVGDISHPESDQIHVSMKRLTRLIKAEGYVPGLDSVLEQLPDKDVPGVHMLRNWT